MRKPHTHLQWTQRLLWRLITAPEGVPKALRSRPKTVLPIEGDSRLSPQDRLDIYANMYFFRILDCLKEDFPAVLKTVGEDRFHNLITDYLIRHPSSHWSLRTIGRYLPGFLKKHSLMRDSRWGFLDDLALLEWLVMEAFDAPDAQALTEESLRAVSPKRWPRLRWKTVPSFYLQRFQWPVDRILKSPSKGRGPVKVKPMTAVIRIWRRGFKVYYRAVEPLEEKILRGIQKGKDFQELCELVSKEIPPEKAPTLLVSYLKNWLRDGILTAK